MDKRVNRLEQRRSDGSLGGLYSGILARSLANAHQSRPRIAHDALDISKVEVDEARQGDEIRDALDALAQDIIGNAERLRDRRLLVDDLHETVVRDRDDRIDVLLEVLNAELRIAAALHALERERTRHDADRQRADLAGALRHDGCGTSARAAAHAGRHEYHVCAAQCVEDIVAALLSGLLADLRLCAGAKAARELLTDLHALRSQGFEQGLRICIDGNEFHTLQSEIDHAVDGIAAAAAYTDYFYFG